jgi:hypothetical protein
MARRKKRPKDAKQVGFWLSPAALKTLDRWAYEEMEGSNRTAALEDILGYVGERMDRWAEKKLRADRRAMGLEPTPEPMPEAPAAMPEPAVPMSEAPPAITETPPPMPPVEVLHDGGSQGASIARYIEPEEPEPEPELPEDVWAEDEDGPPRGHPAWTDLYCDAGECRRRQWRAPGGVTCDEGHGGAPGSPWTHEDEMIRAAYQTDDHHQRTNWRRLERGLEPDDEDEVDDLADEDNLP